MRQAGYLAAAGIYALDHHIEQLAVDHKHAKMLAEAAMKHKDVASCEPVETNIVVLNLSDGSSVPEFLKWLEQNGILAVAFGPQRVRSVTHLDVTENDILAACAILSD
jgi:threonine aldolase